MVVGEGREEVVGEGPTLTKQFSQPVAEEKVDGRGFRKAMYKSFEGQGLPSSRVKVFKDMQVLDEVITSIIENLSKSKRNWL